MTKSFAKRIALFALLSLASIVHADQTIVFMRHGEKPPLGLGQITCQGLNRALALPKVLQGKFGTPTALYAPDPGFTAKDKGVAYNYVRPLATIEPTAIRLGMPVNTSFGLEQIKELEHELLKPANSSAIIFVAWEHNLARTAAKELVQTIGGNDHVPKWADDDFDSLYVLRVRWKQDKPASVHFEIDAEGLNHLSTQCPEAQH